MLQSRVDDAQDPSGEFPESLSSQPIRLSLCTLRWRLRLDTTEKLRPQPGTSHAKAIANNQLLDNREQTTIYLRFSPVWLYIWVWSELGRVKRLSQTLHLCFFCVLDDTLELKEPIMDCGAGGRFAPMSPLGRGKVRALRLSIDSAAEL